MSLANKGCEMVLTESIIVKDEDFLRNHIEARDYTSFLYVYHIFSEEEMESVDVIPEFSKRNEYFLKLLSGKGKYGYTIFKKGLKKRGYLDLKLLHERLKTESEIPLGHIIIDRAWRKAIDPNDEYIILSNYDYIVRKIEAFRLTSYLASKNVIDGYDMSNIDSLPKSLGSKELLRIVCYRGPTSFMWFVEGLRVCGYGRVCAVLLGRPVTASTGKMSTVDDSDSDECCEKENKTETHFNQPENLISKEEETRSIAENVDQQKIISKNDPVDVSTFEGKENETSPRNTNSAENEVTIAMPCDENNSKDSRSSDSSSDSSSSSSSSSNEERKKNVEIIKEKGEESNNFATTNGTDDRDEKDSSATSSSSSSSSSSSNETNKDDNKNMEKKKKTKKGNGGKKTLVKNKAGDNGNMEKMSVDISPSNCKDDVKNRKYVSGTGMDDKIIMKTDVNHTSNENRNPSSPFQISRKRQITREPIDFHLREKLREHETLLETSIEANYVASHLFAHSIIDRGDLETIRGLTNEKQRVQELISLISWGGPNAYGVFMRSLDDSNYSEMRNILLINKQVSETTHHRISEESKHYDIFFNGQRCTSMQIVEVSTEKESDVEDDFNSSTHRTPLLSNRSS